MQRKMRVFYSCFLWVVFLWGFSVLSIVLLLFVCCLACLTGLVQF